MDTMGDVISDMEDTNEDVLDIAEQIQDSIEEDEIY